MLLGGRPWRRHQSHFAAGLLTGTPWLPFLVTPLFADLTRYSWCERYYPQCRIELEQPHPSSLHICCLALSKNSPIVQTACSAWFILALNTPFNAVSLVTTFIAVYLAGFHRRMLRGRIIPVRDEPRGEPEPDENVRMQANVARGHHGCCGELHGYSQREMQIFRFSSSRAVWNGAYLYPPPAIEAENT